MNRKLGDLEFPDPVECELLRRMTPGNRLRAGLQLRDFARRVLTVRISTENPQWSSSKVRSAVNLRLQPDPT